MPRALVVDDDPLNREVMATLCQSLGLEVHQAENGVKALAVFSREAIDIALLDLMMPELGGLGVLEKLRDMPLDPRPVVLVVTAAADAHGRMRGTELGAIDFIEKPFRLPDLQRRVARALALLEMERRLKEAEQALKALRSTDEATGVGATAHLYSVLEAEYRCAELASRPLSCVLVADENYARTLAEQGRVVGQERLQQLTQIIEAVRRPTDYVFRVDAAEFVLLCPATTQPMALKFVHQLLERVGQTLILPEQLAVAIASYPHPQIQQASHLYRAANVALAQARSRPNDRLVWFERF